MTDMDAAVAEARAHGATRLVEIFPDPIGRDALIQWPGGVNMQLYWHTAKPSYAPLATVPDNRIYLTADAADLFIDPLDSASPRARCSPTIAPRRAPRSACWARAIAGWRSNPAMAA